jgi:hypothetical protein
MGFTVVALPIALVLMMVALTLISPKKGNTPEIKTYYDTIKVRQKIVVYDTVKVIKEIKKKKEVKIEEEPIVNDTLK